MAKRYTSKEVVERLQAEIAKGKPLFIPNCGMGLSAKLQEKGGADLIFISPTSYGRLKGLGSLAAFLPFGDFNQIVFNLAKEIVPMVKETPVIAFSAPNNPLLPHKEHLKMLWDLGVSGINPFISKIYGEGFSEQIEQIGMGFSKEVEFVAAAKEMDMFTFSYAFSPEEAEILTEAGSDAICSHVGATKGGAIGAKTSMTLDDAAQLSQKIFDAARKVNKDIILVAHGGPIETPKDAEYIFKHTNAQGFLGGSAAERMPIEKAIVEATQEFKNIPIGK
jgi:predicted TIM-barrel enzyme